jgi:V8-like Glu-specific endopeptidase
MVNSNPGSGRRRGCDQYGWTGTTIGDLVIGISEGTASVQTTQLAVLLLFVATTCHPASVAASASPPARHLATGSVRRLLEARWRADNASATVTRVSSAVGPLFQSRLGGRHSCTASVVASPGGNLLVTAAHCIRGGGGYRTGLVFAPGYLDGRAPHGVWKVSAMFVDREWASSGDPDDDVGFIVLRPLGGRDVADVTGANTLGLNAPFGEVVTVSGYPSDSGRPVVCTGRASRHSAHQMRFDCGGFTGGTSGGPWVTRSGQVVGVIGGYQRGGYTSSVSYSPRFGDRVRALYDTAAASAS